MSDKDIIIFDLDGTLADCSHRVHHILKKPKVWTTFFAACGDDRPIEHMIKLFRILSPYHGMFCDYEVWIVSGRSDECRYETEQWLASHVGPYDRLIMRKAGDYTDDSILKPSWLEDGTIPKERVLVVFDDRNRVVQAWRAAGVPCMHVADGDF